MSEWVCLSLSPVAVVWKVVAVCEGRCNDGSPPMVDVCGRCCCTMVSSLGREGSPKRVKEGAACCHDGLLP